jgi:transcriptional regulator with XRE-family HTH domain
MTPKQIKKLRLSANLSQMEMAEKLGVSKGAIAHWETGRCKPLPSHIKLIQLVIISIHKQKNIKWIKQTAPMSKIDKEDIRIRARMGRIAIAAKKAN